MTDNTQRATFLVDEASYEVAKDKLDHGELSEELRQTVNRIAHGADVAQEERLTDQLEDLREDRREKRQDRERIEHELEELNRKIERAEAKLTNLREQEGEYDGVLAMLEEDLSEGARVMVGSDKVQRAARIGNCDPEDVIDDLQERNPDVPEKAFRPARGDESPRWDEDSTEAFR